MTFLPTDPEQAWRWIGGATAAVNLILAFLVHIRNRRLAYRSFAYLSLALSLWNFFHVKAYPDYADPAWMRLLFTTLAFVPALARTFAREFLGLGRAGPWEPRLLYGGGLLILTTIWTPFFDSTLWRVAFVGFFFPPLLGSLADFWGAFRRAKAGPSRNSLAYLCLASAIATLGGLLEFVPHFGLPMPPWPFASASMLVYTVMMAYAIQTHQLLDIRTVFRRGASMAALLAASGGASAAVIAASARLLGTDPADLFVPLFLLIVLSMLVWDRWGDRIKGWIWREEFGRESRGEAWMRSLQGLLGLEEVASRTRSLLKAELGAENCAVLVCEPGLEPAGGPAAWTPALGALRDGLIREDLERGPPPAGLDAPQGAEVACFMDEWGFSALVPVAHEGRLYGALGLGPRRDGFYDPIVMGWLARVSAALSQSLHSLRIHAELLHADRLAHLGTVAAGIAHEVRNPLSYLSRALEFFRTQGSDPQGRSKTLDSMERELDRLNVLVEDILAYAAPRPASRRSCDVVAEIEELVGILRPSFDESLRLRWDPPPDRPRAAMDPGRLKQVLLNLVRNSRSALSAAGRPGTISVSVAAGEGTVRIAVSDDGPGIPPERMKTLFEPFSPGSRGGTGLGLAIVDKLVRLHDGRILVSSLPDAGARFDVEIPACRGKDPSAGEPGAPTLL